MKRPAPPPPSTQRRFPRSSIRTTTVKPSHTTALTGSASPSSATPTSLALTGAALSPGGTSTVEALVNSVLAESKFGTSPTSTTTYQPPSTSTAKPKKDSSVRVTKRTTKRRPKVKQPRTARTTRTSHSRRSTRPSAQTARGGGGSSTAMRRQRRKKPRTLTGGTSKPRPDVDKNDRRWDLIPELSQYVLLETMGEGTFGRVKRGFHKLTRIPVAVKILEKAKIVDLADVMRVEREIFILKQVNHPNVVRLYEVIDSEEFIFLIMEYCQGGELFQHIVKHTRVPEDKAVVLFHHLINGIDHCHRRNVIHRDLKPENMLLGDHDELKIIDFGLGNVTKPNKLLSTACGSPCYAAPEMIEGYDYVGSVSDMWSVGVVLYAILCGFLPFEDPSTARLYDKILAADYEMPDFLSPLAQDMLRRLLTTDPKRRITADQIRRHPWYTQVKVDSDPEPGKVLPQWGRDKIVPETVFVQQDILEHMVSLGYKLEDVLTSMKQNKHDEHTAMYVLLEKYKNNKLAELAEEEAEKEEAAEVEEVEKEPGQPSPAPAEQLPVEQPKPSPSPPTDEDNGGAATASESEDAGGQEGSSEPTEAPKLVPHPPPALPASKLDLAKAKVIAQTELRQTQRRGRTFTGRLRRIYDPLAPVQKPRERPRKAASHRSRSTGVKTRAKTRMRTRSARRKPRSRHGSATRRMYAFSIGSSGKQTLTATVKPRTRTRKGSGSTRRSRSKSNRRRSAKAPVVHVRAMPLTPRTKAKAKSKAKEGEGGGG